MNTRILITALICMAGCFHEAPPTVHGLGNYRIHKAPATEVRHLANAERVPVIDREALVVAGYYNPFGEPIGSFIVMLPNDRRMFDTDAAFHLSFRSTPAELERAVDAWLENGRWHPMVMATKVDPGDGWERWSFPSLGINATVRKTGFLQFFHGDQRMGTSPLFSIGEPVGNQVSYTQAVHVQQLAYDPTTHLVWVVYVLDDASLTHNPESMVHTFFLWDQSRFPSLMPSEGQLPPLQ